MDSTSGKYRKAAGRTSRYSRWRSQSPSAARPRTLGAAASAVRRSLAVVTGASLAALGLAALAATPALAAGTPCATPDTGYTNCVYYSTAGDNTFVVPAGVTSLYVQEWGAGGGGIPDSAATTQYGAGAGGYTSGVVTVAPAQTLNLTVGEGGDLGAAGDNNGASGGIGFAGDGGDGLGFSGSAGGGMTSLWSGVVGTSPPELIAGGGGGAAAPTSTSSGHTVNADTTDVSGGGGGGTSGTAFETVADGDDGGPGTQAGGGTAAVNGTIGNCDDSSAETGDGHTGGSPYFGGDGASSDATGSSGGGGGGGGYGGGGGGNCLNPTGTGSAGDGGGGASFIGGPDVQAGALTFTDQGSNGFDAGTGSSASPDTSDSSQYLSGVGLGGGADGFSDGGNGEVVIEWSSAVHLAVTKSANPSPFVAGQPLTYTVTVTNSGPAPATGVTVDDTLPAGFGAFTWTCVATGAASSCPSASGTGSIATSGVAVDAGGQVQYVVTGTVPLGTTNAGNSVTVFASPNQSDPTCDASHQCVATVDPSAGSIGVVQVAAPPSYNHAGQQLTFTDTVTNTGTVTLTGVGVSNNLAGATTPVCLLTTLTAGQHTTCTSTYAVLQTDMDAGSVTNLATASGTDPSASTVSATSSVTVPAALAPGLTVVKSALPTTYVSSGVVITFSFVVTNTGNVTMSNIHLTDPMANLTFGPCGTVLAPAVSETCTATYTTTNGDVVNGSVVNSAYVTGTTPAAVSLTSAPSMVTVPVAAGATGGSGEGISLVKSASPASFYKPGQTIQFSFAVENTGLQPLSAIRFNDPLAGLSTITCPLATLQPAVTMTCTAQYTTTQEDVDLGSVTNAGTVQATLADGISVTSLPSTVTVPEANRPEIAVSNTASPLVFRKAGAVIHYTLSVQNTGNVTLHNVRVKNQFLPGLSAIRCPSQILRVGKFMNCYARYVTTRADVRAGKVVDQVTAFGEPAGSALAQVSDSSMATVIYKQQRN